MTTRPALLSLTFAKAGDARAPIHPGLLIEYEDNGTIEVALDEHQFVALLTGSVIRVNTQEVP